jgi:hypothetical protein
MLEGRTHSDDFSANKREGCLGQNGPKAKETPFRASNTIVLDERTRVFPIAEPKTIVIRTSTEVEDNPKMIRPMWCVF